MNDKKRKKLPRIVIKIGTSSITHNTGRLNYRHIEEMVSVICDLKNMGHEIVVVSSGAMGSGLGKLNLNEKPEESSKKRALAAAGQSGLMAIYEELFGIYERKVAQVLLTNSMLSDNAYNNIATAFESMFEYDVIPIVNENDVVTTNDPESNDYIGNNDILAAYVAKIIKSNILIIWSDIDGLYNKDPRENTDAQLISLVTELNDDIYKMAGGAGTSRGRGGMLTKLNAARIVMDAGIDMVIANSDRPEDIYEILNEKGKRPGTTFSSQKALLFDS